MSGGLPLRRPVERTPAGRTVPFEEAGAVFDALASETARGVLAHLRESPAPASEVAAAMDVSIQSATYHLDRLVAAGLVDCVDTWYSAKGREMDVYAARPVTVVCGARGVDSSDAG
jgi:DNA-binding transcriptional ArsR family regulator